MNLTEQDWNVFELIGLDCPTRDIAKLCNKEVAWVWRVRSKLGRKLNLRGPKLVVTAVKCVWIREHDPKHPHIAEIYKRFNLNQNKP